MRSAPIVALLTVISVAGTLAGQTRQDNWKRCVDSNPDLRIGGCTAVIQAGQETDANLAMAFNDRGLAYHDKGSYDLAIQDFDQAIRLNPNYAQAFNNRGNAYRNKGSYDLAIQDYDQALKLKPNYLHALRGRGVANFDRGQFAAAIPDFAAAVKSTPSDAYSVLWLYVAQSRARQNGRSELAQNAAQLKLAAWPGPVVNLYLGRATSDAVLSAAADPNQRCEAYFFVAERSLLAGRRTEAARFFEESIRTGAKRELQYRAAQEELSRLNGATAGTGTGR